MPFVRERFVDRAGDQSTPGLAMPHRRIAAGLRHNDHGDM